MIISFTSEANIGLRYVLLCIIVQTYRRVELDDSFFFIYYFIFFKIIFDARPLMRGAAKVRLKR